MNKLFKAALELQDFLSSLGWEFCIIGGLAVQRWGEPRVTRDVDVTLLTRFSDEESFIDQILARYEGRIENPKMFGLVNRVLLIKNRDGVAFDIALGGMPFEVDAVARATYFKFAPGVELRTASAEDLVIMKAFAGRPKDWEDLTGILIRNPNLDWDHIEAHLVPLAEVKEEPEIIQKLNELRNQIAGKPETSN